MSDDRKPSRILVVEDSPTQAARLAIILEAEGFEVATARDGEQGLAIFDAEPVDVVLSDIVMPSMSGYELCRRIKADDRGRDVPVILLSTLSDPKDLLEGLDCGADNFIPKPYEADYLVRRVRSVLANREIRAASNAGDGIDLVLLGRRVTITSDKEQIVDLLVSSFESLVRSREAEQAARAEAERVGRRAAFLSEMSALLSSSLDLRETLEAALRHTLGTLCDGAIVVVDESDLRTPLVVVHADASAERAMRASLEAVVVVDDEAPVERGAVSIGDGVEAAAALCLPRAQVERALDAARFDAMIAIPLVAHNARLGAVLFGRRASYDPDDLALALDAGSRIAATVENGRLFAAANDANRAKDEFLAMVSHELRTPLSAMLGWTHLIRTGSLDEAMLRRALDTIDRNARLQQQLLDDLVDISRITNGRFQLDVAEIDLPTIVGEAVDANRPLADQKEIALALDTDLEAWRLVADANRLHQVFTNLLTNAIKFTPSHGHIDVRVATDGDEAVVAVSDTGIGIDPEFLPYVFERFQQAKTSEQRKGLGLGLAIVRTIVEMHGGRVTVASEGEGKGACFSVYLPGGSAAPPDSGAR